MFITMENNDHGLRIDICECCLNILQVDAGALGQNKNACMGQNYLIILHSMFVIVGTWI